MSKLSRIGACVSVFMAAPFLRADEVSRLVAPRMELKAAQNHAACAARGGPSAAPGLVLIPNLTEKARTKPGSRGIAASAGETGSDRAAVTEQQMSGEQPEGCIRSLAGRTAFGAGDPAVYYRTKLSGVHAGDVIRWEWTGPDGSLRKSTHLVADFEERGCVWDGMPIAGGEAESLPGDWQVAVFVNSAPVSAASFAIVPGDTRMASARMVRQTMANLFAGYAQLGFAVTRASCTGSDPLGGAVLDLMRGDLTGFANSLTGAAAVLPFDVNRATSLRDALRNMTGNQAADALLNLFSVEIQVVRDAKLSCDPGAGALALPPAVDGLLSAATRLGIVSAFALCFQCNETLTPEAAAFISDQLNIASGELRPFATCIKGFDFGSLAGVPVGPSFTSIQSYVPLTALLNAIQQAILANDCTCGADGGSGGSGSATVRGTVRNASNSQTIVGATVVVAGTNLSAATAADGTFSFSGVPAGQQILRASATGFIQAEVQMSVAAGQTLTQNISLSPTLQGGEIRITLNWTKDSSGTPDDLDMHMGGPSPSGSSCFEVYYGNNGSLTAAPFTQLEVDNIQQPGHPPTETIRIARLTAGIYRLYIHNFSGERADGLAQSQAAVHVFSSAGQIFSQNVPSGSGRFWSVLTLNGQTGAIGLVNQLSASDPALTPCR